MREILFRGKAKQVERKELEKARIKSETAKFLIKSQKA